LSWSDFGSTNAHSWRYIDEGKIEADEFESEDLGRASQQTFLAVSVAHTVGDMSKHRYKNGNNQFVAPQDDE
jgi:hypothetical protein